MAKSKDKDKYTVIYLPSVYDPKKVREGIREILYCVETLALKDKAKGQEEDAKE